MVNEYRGHELPYIFDLLWDVKTYEQVERIAKFEADCSDADPYDLVELFQKENLEIPKCLKGFVQKDDTNNCKCGKGNASSYDGLCRFCREKLFSRSEAKRVGVRTRGDGMSVGQYTNLKDNGR